MSGTQVFHEAFVTLTTSDSYALGCLVLAHSLRRVQTTRQLVVMVTSGVSQTMRQRLCDVFDVVTTVDVLDSRDMTNLKLLDRPDLGVTFTKLHCWRLTQFTKCVFIDADAMVLKNIDDLFEREELSAAPDPGWPDCFNSGVFVFCPSETTYQSLLEFAVSAGSFDGGDQGLLNMFFSDWATKDIKRHLPFLYNVVSQAFYSYLPAFKQFGKDCKVVHFIGPVKPWMNTYNTATGKVIPKEGTGHNGDYLQLWWDIFMECVQPNLDNSMALFLRFVHEEPAPPPPQQTCWEPQYQQYYSPPVAPPAMDYNMPTPYVPPVLSQTFYEPPPVQSSSSAPNVGVIPPPPPREYHFFESHYTETPLSQVDVNKPPPEVYGAKDFFDPQPSDLELKPPEEPPREDTRKSSETEDRGIIEFAGDDRFKGDEDNVSEIHVHVTVDVTESTPGDHSESVTSCGDGNIESSVPSGGDKGNVSNCDDDSSTEETKVELVELVTESVGSVESDEDSDIDSDVSSEELTTDEESDCESSDEMGIVGELATLQLDMGASSGFPAAPVLSDRERRDKWERGQMDYMGADRFEFILERIDTTIKNGSGANAKPPAAAPSATKPPASEGGPPTVRANIALSTAPAAPVASRPVRPTPGVTINAKSVVKK